VGDIAPPAFSRIHLSGLVYENATDSLAEGGLGQTCSPRDRIGGQLRGENFSPQRALHVLPKPFGLLFPEKNQQNAKQKKRNTDRWQRTTHDQSDEAHQETQVFHIRPPEVIYKFQRSSNLIENAGLHLLAREK
jgi:hypothetical protein